MNIDKVPEEQKQKYDQMQKVALLKKEQQQQAAQRQYADNEEAIKGIFEGRR